jgi:hypothetical protein
MPTLKKGCACRFQLLLILASAVILGSKSCGAHDYVLLSQIRDSSNLEGQAPVFISPRNSVAQLCSPGTGIRFRLLLRLAGLRWRYSNAPPLCSPAILCFKVKVTLRLTVNQSVSQSVSQSVTLGVEPNLGLMTRYLLLFDSFGLVFVERPL